MANIFADNFNRGNSTTVGNGWTETETDVTNFQTLSNTLLMQGSVAAAVNTVMYQSLSKLSGIAITFTLNYDDTVGGTHYVGAVTKATTAFGTGLGVRINRDSTSQITIAIVDDNVVKTSTTFSLADGTTCNFEVDIQTNFKIDVYAWTSSKPATPTLSQPPFSPTASGSNQAIFRTQTGGNTRNVQLDNWSIDDYGATSVGNLLPFFI